MLKTLLGIALFYGRFLPSFTKLGYLVRQRSWPPAVSGLGGQTWLITGASGGIGYAAGRLAQARGAAVIAVARNQKKLAANQKDIDAPAWVSKQCDLSLRGEIDQLVRQLIREKRRVDVLVNNVGVMLHKFSQTSEGVETMFATNLLNHYYLTERLLAAEILHRDSTVINVTSGGLYMAPLRVESLNCLSASEHDGVRLYALQKRAQTVMNNHWQKRHGKTGPRFYAMHPGWVDTQGVRDSLPRFRRCLRPLLRTPEQGADTMLWLAHQRPRQQEALWFDRKPKPLHVYDFTRTPENAEPRLIEYLESFLPPEE